jgi:hypothetical protein
MAATMINREHRAESSPAVLVAHQGWFIFISLSALTFPLLRLGRADWRRRQCWPSPRPFLAPDLATIWPPLLWYGSLKSTAFCRSGGMPKN